MMRSSINFEAFDPYTTPLPPPRDVQGVTTGIMIDYFTDEHGGTWTPDYASGEWIPVTVGAVEVRGVV
jgi:hypothetical protein